MADGFSPEDLEIIQKIKDTYDEVLGKQRESLRLRTEEARLAGEQIGYARRMRRLKNLAQRN